MSNYDDLLDAVRKEAEVFRAKAGEYVPKMYEALRKESVEPSDAKDRIEKDLADVWSKDTIRRHIPDEAKNKTISERAKQTNKDRAEKKMGINPISEGGLPLSKVELAAIVGGGTEPLRPSMNDEPVLVGNLPAADLRETLSEMVKENQELRARIVEQENDQIAKDLEQMIKENHELRARIKELENDEHVKELVKLLIPFHFETTIDIQGKEIPIIVAVNVQGRNAKVVVNEALARRMYQI